MLSPTINATILLSRQDHIDLPEFSPLSEKRGKKLHSKALVYNQVYQKSLTVA